MLTKHGTLEKLTDRWVHLLCCWRDVTLMVALRMAQAAKRQGGTSILWVGLRFHGTFGAVVIPPPKRARAVSELRRMHSGDEFTLEDAMSIAGLLEHLTPFASELRSSMYHMYYPHKAFHKHGMQFRFLPPPAMQNQARKWMERLVQRPGIACTAVLVSAREEGGTTLVMSSDAAKDGTPTPGVGGHMHGFSWYLPLLPCDVVGPLQLPINWLEFLAVYGNFEIFGPSVPLLHSRLLQLTDSLTSAIVLTNHSAKSEGMQLVHLKLLQSSEFIRLAAITDVAHVFGPGMVFADAVSRGYFDIVKQLCIQCHTAHQWLVVPATVVALLDELRALARRLAGVSDRAYSSAVVEEGAVSLSLSARGEQRLVRSNGRQAAVAISIFSGSLVGGHPANSAITLSGLCARSVCQLSCALSVCFDVTRSGGLSSAGGGSTADCGGSSSGVAASATGSVAVFPTRRGK